MDMSTLLRGPAPGDVGWTSLVKGHVRGEHELHEPDRLRADAIQRCPVSVVHTVGVTLLVTIDTNQLDDHRIRRLRALLYLPHELAFVTVTGRERGEVRWNIGSIPESLVWGESRWGEAVWGRPIPEAWVLGESPLGAAVLGGEDHVDVLETALVVITDGSFPHSGKRDALTGGQLRQLRDAMIFEAHVRERRHLLVTEDAKGFISRGRRAKLEALGRTRILTPDELEALSLRRELEELVGVEE